MAKGNKKFNKKTTGKGNAHSGKQPVKEAPKVFLNYYYMTPADINSRNVVDSMKDISGLDIEIWEDVEVIEVGLSMKQTIDIVKMDESFGDENDRKFLSEHGIKSVFSIEVEQSNTEQLKSVFEHVIEANQGFVCSDSDDFMPFIVK